MQHPKYLRAVVVFGLAVVTVLGGKLALAQDAAAEAAGVAQAVAVGQALSGHAGRDGAAAAGSRSPAFSYSLVDLVQFGGVIGYLIILLSVLAVALAVAYARLLRPSVLMPAGEIEALRSFAVSGTAPIATEQRSLLGSLVAAGVAERDHGYDAVIKALEDRAEELGGRLLRRIESLNMIANAAPMLGLLGTVVGMMRCFYEASVSLDGVDPQVVAAGIFQALMTTVLGLAVAIPAFLAFSILRNRVGELVADATATARELVASLRPAARYQQQAPHAGRA